MGYDVCGGVGGVVLGGVTCSRPICLISPSSLHHIHLYVLHNNVTLPFHLRLWQPSPSSSHSTLTTHPTLNTYVTHTYEPHLTPTLLLIFTCTHFTHCSTRYVLNPQTDGWKGFNNVFHLFTYVFNLIYLLIYSFIWFVYLFTYLCSLLLFPCPPLSGPSGYDLP